MRTRRLLGWMLFLAACGGERPAATVPARASSPDDAAAPVEAVPTIAAPLGPNAVPAGCAQALVGVDLRCLPVGTSTSGIDMFVLAQIDDIRRLVPDGVSAEFFVTSGVSSFDAVFRAETPEQARAACRQTLDTWLPTAPRLPVIMEPAANAGPCEPCVPREPAP